LPVGLFSQNPQQNQGNKGFTAKYFPITHDTMVDLQSRHFLGVSS
jgi:hypothetical protein